jgi:threonine dehydratase
MTKTPLPVTLEDVRLAAQRIAADAIHTPLIQLPMNGEVYAKAESLQRTGAFKFRGAHNTITSLEPDVRARGVVTSSSGSHAQGVAASAHLHGVPSVIIMTETAPEIKVEQTQRWGAEVIRFGRSAEEAQVLAKNLALERHLTFIPPFDDLRTIAGQGTVGLEIAEDLPDVQTVLVCVGGGGLLSGILIAIKHLCPNARVIGVEPEFAADAQESFRTHQRVSWVPERVGRTICDGVRTQCIGELNFEIISRLADDMIAVSDDAVLEAMRFYALEAKLAVEPTGALTLAAVRSGAVKLEGKTVVILSGGNFDPPFMAKVLES